MPNPVCESEKSPNVPPQGPPGPAVATRPAPTRPALDKLPPYRVLLHDDPVNTQDFVVDSLVELTPLNRDRASEVMLEADKSGVALVLVTHKERAELYQEQFRSKLLTVSIEPAE